MSIIDSIAGFVSGIFKPATELASEYIEDPDKLNEFKTKLSQIEHDTANKLLDLQKEAMESSAKVAVAETQSDNWFTKSYRPIIISGMFVLFVLNSFGLLQVQLPEIFISIFGATFGVTSVSRGLEKITKIRTLGRNNE